MPGQNGFWISAMTMAVKLPQNMATTMQVIAQDMDLNWLIMLSF